MLTNDGRLHDKVSPLSCPTLQHRTLDSIVGVRLNNRGLLNINGSAGIAPTHNAVRQVGLRGSVVERQRSFAVLCSTCS